MSVERCVEVVEESLEGEVRTYEKRMLIDAG
jgi:hypothetical protein